ncbi:neuronal tyrosine-phosphorylated phosphoinositide-3-kinase adapter 2 [Trichomycterus rosablanca]|uniref:neuronal tyrosine-phosphorylated phosphoinositide-3-kinase adapter 2 n=1 Tax=Trichomycterus rosablanca TaxID=2290929 RepID=UPI002F351F49
MDGSKNEYVHFMQYVEDSGLKAYDELVIQNASDIARESDRVRQHRAYLMDQSQKKRWMGEDVEGEEAYTGKHFRMGFMTMPAPLDRLSEPTGLGFTVRSQSLHSVGGGKEDGGSLNLRKQPPPKPKRNPSTKLSTSSETVNTTLTTGKRSKELDKNDALKSLLCSEEYRLMPPPKPKRNPSTQLSTSFDESYIQKHSNKFKSSTLPRQQKKSLSQNQSCALDTDEETEPVYIDMVGNILHDFRHFTGHNADEENDQGESVYEEMKYPIFEEAAISTEHIQSCLKPCSNPAVLDEALTKSTQRGPHGDIPAPFPNLLTQKAPLLEFPSAPTQCSPNSDESPLTPLDVTKLPMLDNCGFGKPSNSSTTGDSGQALPGQQSMGQHNLKQHNHKKSENKEPQSTQTITASGRSSAPPLLSASNKSSGSSAAHGYPRSHSACPSPLSMGQVSTPLSLKCPPYDALLTGTIPLSTSRVLHRSCESGHLLGSSSIYGGSMQNVSTASVGSTSGSGARSPTSSLDELSNITTYSKNMLRKDSGGHKSKELSEIKVKTRSHSSDSKDQALRNSPKRLDWDTPSGQSATPTNLGHPSLSPTTMLAGGASEPKAACKLGHSASTSGVSTSIGTPQRHAQEQPLSHQTANPFQMLPLSWACNDNTMIEMIEKKRHLCKEIKARQKPDKALCKQDSLPILPSWKNTNGSKMAPPYSAQTTIFWDTAV